MAVLVAFVGWTGLDILLPGVLVLAGLILGLLLLWRSGWAIKDLRRLRIGSFEVERGIREEVVRPATQDSTTVSGRVDVRVVDNVFEQNVGDIGGVIIKRADSCDDNGST